MLISNSLSTPTSFFREQQSVVLRILVTQDLQENLKKHLLMAHKLLSLVVHK